MTRQDYNKIILNDLKRQDFFEKFIPDETSVEVYDILEECMEIYPDQRFGQIFTNYIYPDYRSRTEDGLNQVMDMLFYKCGCDPFYEESSETVKRLNIEI